MGSPAMGTPGQPAFTSPPTATAASSHSPEPPCKGDGRWCTGWWQRMRRCGTAWPPRPPLTSLPRLCWVGTRNMRVPSMTKPLPLRPSSKKPSSASWFALCYLEGGKAVEGKWTQVHFSRLEQQLGQAGPTCDCGVDFTSLVGCDLVGWIVPTLPSQQILNIAWLVYSRFVRSRSFPCICSSACESESRPCERRLWGGRPRDRR